MSHNQKDHLEGLFAGSRGTRSKRVLLKSWEEFNEPVDRIVSIGAFEHFGFDKYETFFTKAFKLMPADGVMLLHTIATQAKPHDLGLPITMSLLRFYKFIAIEIFPGGQIPLVRQVETGARQVGFGRHQNPAVGAALRPHPGHLGAELTGEKARGDRDHLGRGVRTLRQIPDGVVRSCSARATPTFANLPARRPRAGAPAV